MTFWGERGARLGALGVGMMALMIVLAVRSVAGGRTGRREHRAAVDAFRREVVPGRFAIGLAVRL